MIMTTVPDCCVTQGLSEEILSRIPNIGDAHPTMIHVVRKGPTNRRICQKETVPDVQHWAQEF